VLRRTFGRRRAKERQRDRRELHNEEHSSLSVIRMVKSRRMRWIGHVTKMEKKTHTGYWRNDVKPEGKRPLGRSRRRWVDNIKIRPKQDEMV
jgi:hypothetical protein